MSDRPDYVHCVATGVAHDSHSWCGKPLVGWYFQDATHAALNGLKGGRLLACPDCSEAIQRNLKKGTWQE